MWRQTMRRFRKSVKAVTKRREYLKQWRKIRKDSKLKSVPTYFELAKRRGLSTSFIKQPAKICMLTTLSHHENIMTPNAILNYGKTYGRHQFRMDGRVPTLGHGCLTFFVPTCATCLSIPQLLCLSGFHPKANKNIFELSEIMKKNDMGLLIGNSMCVPLVGHVMAAALGLICPCCR